MTNLYNELAGVYEAMYYSFIDYHEEFVFYSSILKKHKKKSLLEIGSGTGNLARYFLENRFDYTGLDYSPEMIEIAKKKVPEAKFVEGDMRNFEFHSPLEGVIITARSISYLSKGEEINTTFSCIHKALKPKGILSFDFIDANRFIPQIFKEKKVVHEAAHEGIQYVREGIWTLNLAYGLDLNWEASYFKKSGNELLEIGKDQAIVRTFSLNEMEVFLHINQFKIKEVIDRPSYAFPTYVIVAERL